MKEMVPWYFLPGKGVGGDGRLLAELNPSQVRFADIGPQPDFIQQADGDHRSSHSHLFTRLDIFRQHQSAYRRNQRRVSQSRFRQGQDRFCALEAGASLIDGFLAWAAPEQFQPFLGFTNVRLGTLVSRPRDIKVPGGDDLFFEQLLLAAKVDSETFCLCFNPPEDRFGLGNFFLAVACLEFRQQRAGRLCLGPAACRFMEKICRVQPGDNFTRLYQLPFVNGTFA